MKYRILEESTVHALEVKVNEYIANGWKPQGGVTWSSQMLEGYYMQAMIIDE